MGIMKRPVQLPAAKMKCLTCALLLLLVGLISAYPGTVVVNGVCLTCPNPNGERVIINGQEYRSFDNGNVILDRPGYNNNAGYRIYRDGHNTIVNGRCQYCNVEP